MSDNAVFELVTNGELQRAAEVIVRLYGRDIVGLCIGMVRDRALAEDLAQDALTRAFASLASFRGDSSVRTWLMSIARNRCLDHLRRTKVAPWDQAHTDFHDVDARLDDAPLTGDLLSDRKLIEHGLAALDESERAMIILRFRHGLEYDEMAEVFGLRAGTVRMRVSRALARMRDAIAPPVLGAPAMSAPRASATRAGAPPPSAAAFVKARVPLAPSPALTFEEILATFDPSIASFEERLLMIVRSLDRTPTSLS